MVKGQEMEMSLGLPVYLDSFIDGMPRKCYPYTLANLSALNMYLSAIDDTKFENLEQNQLAPLLYLLTESFRDEEVEKVIENIDDTNFDELISDIKYVSGISDGQKEIDVNKSTSSLSWSKSVSIIQCYTSNTPKDICNMTIRQFDALLDEIGIVVNWEYKTTMLPHIADNKNYISDKEHPLSADVHKYGSQKRMTMRDMDSFMKEFKK